MLMAPAINYREAPCKKVYNKDYQYYSVSF